MKIATHMTDAYKIEPGEPRPDETYRSFRRKMAKIRHRIAITDGARNDPTIQRATRRPRIMSHQSTRECERRVRQGLVMVQLQLAAE